MDATRGVSEVGGLPAGLLSMAAGAELGAVLAAVDRSVVGADGLLDLIAARARQLWHLQGELLADLAQAVTAALAAGPAQPDEDEDRVADAVGGLVGWTVHWTTGYAQGQVEVAVALSRRLPMVLAALRAGEIDQAKAAAFVDALSCVSDEVAARIAARLLPKARTWTLTELRASLRYHVDRADPTAARRRYRKRVAERDVYLRGQPDGTANLSGQGLAPHRAAAAFDRIDRIARAARAGGDVRNLAQLRADVLCDVLAGVPFQLTPTTDPLTAQADAAAPTELVPMWSLPHWRTESRFPTRKPGPDDRGDPGGGGPGGGSGGGPGGGGPGGSSAGGGSPSGGSGGPGGGPSGGGPGGGGLSGGGPGGDGFGGGGGGGHDPAGTSGADDGWPWELTPPEREPVGIIDLYDYDRACLTDCDRAWVDIGYEPPGAADDEAPDWWHACHPTRPSPDHDRPHWTDDGGPDPAESDPYGQAETTPHGTAAAGCPGAAETDGDGPAGADSHKQADSGHTGPVGAGAEESRSENRNRWSGPEDLDWAMAQTGAAAEESRSENRNRWSEPEDLDWVMAQADALHLRAVLSRDVLAGDRCVCGGRLTGRPGVVDVQVKLTTLAGLDEHPALIPGLGVALAPLARQIAFDPHTRPTWRWSIFDDAGELLHHGVTRHRPDRPSPPETRKLPSETRKPDSGNRKPDSETGETSPSTGEAGWCTCARVEAGQRRGSIELQLTLATLHELIAQPQRAPGWQSVLADIATQVEQDRQANPPGLWSQTDEHGRLRHHGHTARMPDAVEEAFIRARDRSCRAPHCPVPASRCELDHRVEHAKGGPSHRGNVDTRCKRHHHLRDRGYHITKTGPTTTWTVPSGRTFPVAPDKDLILTRDD